MKKINKNIKATMEISMLMFMLLTNVFMWFFTKDIKENLSFIEKIGQTITIENLIISFIAWSAYYIIINLIIRRN